MRKILRSGVLLMGFLLLCLFSFAQGKTVRGTVTDENNAPLAGATVSVKGTSKSTLTNAEGQFTIEATKGQSLVISFVGFTSQEVEVGPSGSVAVKLKQGQNSLQDIVVVGYGTQKRANLTGAVSTVNVKEQLGSRPISDVARGLQGSVPGLTITTPSGDIGTNPSITLRGLTGSLNGPGAKPLILVDNVELPDLRMINPNDIESITVLKDAASASIYGTRGAWGVVLITTKSGKRGGDRNQISYNNGFSFSQPTTLPRVAPAAEGAEMALLAYQRNNPNTTSFSSLGMTVTEASIQKMREWEQKYGNQNLGLDMVMGRDFEIGPGGELLFYRSWDPMDIYLRDWAPQQTHNLTFSGSNEKTGYTLGLGYFDQKGVLKVNPDQFQRFNVNLGVNSAVTSWLDARAKILLSRAKRTRPYYYSSETYDPWYYLTRWQAYYPYGTYEGKPFRSALTEVQQAHMTPIIDNMARVQVGGTLKIARGLTFDADYTFASNSGREQQTGGKVTAYNFWGGKLTYEPYSSASYDRAVLLSDWSERNTVKAFATYNKNISDHNFKLIAGTDVELYQYGSERAERRGLINPDMGQPNLATGDQLVGSSAGHWSTLGYFGRLNYSYKNKFLFEVNGRYDGSSSFPVKDHWGFFPSVSAGYVLTQEKFMDFSQNVLSFLKFRGSWGSIGNQALGGNKFLSIMSATSSNWIIGSNNMPTVTTPPLVSPSLTWETVTTLDFGADARFFHSKLGMTFDWYRRTTTDMITAGITVPSSLGTSAPSRNYGDLQTQGWELSLDWNHKFGRDFNLNVTGVLSDFTEKLTKYAANSTKLISSLYEGKVLGEIWGYETDRYFTADDFQKDANGDFILQNGKYVLNDGIASQSRWEAGTFFYGPGDIKYKDLNGDGVIGIGTNTVTDPGDQRVIGNSTPRYQYGIRLGLDWKGFDANFFVQGVGSRQMWANGPVVIPGYRIGEGWYAHHLDYWTPENPNAYYPRPTDQQQSNATRNFLPQTKYLLNMAYTRLKNINIGYTLPAKVSSKASLQSVRIYVSGENLLTFDHLNVPIDPEVNYTDAGLNDSNTFGRVYPYRKVLSFGVQVTL